MRMIKKNKFKNKNSKKSMKKFKEMLIRRNLQEIK